MRTVNFRDGVLYPIAHLLGITPDPDLSVERAAQWCSFINTRVKEAWKFWDWPELTVTEERPFRRIWNSLRTFRRAGANGLPDEFFYLPTFKYYKVLKTAGSDPVAGTLPTNTSFFESLDVTDRFIDYDQGCRRAIGEVYGVYNGNPRLYGGAGIGGLHFRPSERGIDVGLGGGLTVFIHYKIRPSRFTTAAYDITKAYRPGDLAYWTNNGEVYRALITSTGLAPSNPTAWAKVPMPEILADFVKLAAASDAADDLQTTAKLLAEAYESLKDEVDSLVVQGETHRYGWGAQTRQIFVPYGVSGFWWSISPPWTDTGGTVTTLTDVCQNEFGEVEETDMFAEAEGGLTDLVQGQDYIDVVFTDEKVDAEGDPTNQWDFTVLAVEYPGDPPPDKIWVTTIVKTSTGFRAYLNDGPSDGLYKLRWRVNAGFVAA